MKRLFRAAAVVAFLEASLVSPAWTQGEPDPRGQSVAVASAEDAIALADGSWLWFVELAGPPTADGGDLATILAEQATFRAAASQAGIRHTEQKAFKNLWNGLSIAVHPADLPKLRRVQGVAALYPVVTFTLPEQTPVDEIELLTALAMTGADIAQNEHGLTGAGIKVGIIDTGIDYDHPDLGGDGIHRTDSPMFPNGRVITGYDFVGDAFIPGSVAPVQDPYPDDCNGHGTHVSGIVGANGGITGVAPGVVFGAYRVIGCGNTTSAAVMIEAMERALADGMQIVNMSIGSGFQWPSYPTAAASDRLVDQGVVVVSSFGNSGTAGLYAGSAPGVGRKVIGVASYDNTHINVAAFTITPDSRVAVYNPGIDVPPAPLSGTWPMARTGAEASTADACSPLPAGSLPGKVALIRRGTCSSYVKATHARNAGAVGVVIYNNAAGGMIPVLTPPPGQPLLSIPVVGITAADGAVIDGRLAAGPVDMTWTEGVSTPTTTGGVISGFSSHGIAPDLAVKPDIGAPGGFIRSTVPLNQGGYAQNSGTSMSSPHVAGAVALLLEAHPNTPSQAVGDILRNNAVPRPRSATIPQLDLISRQGSGLLNIADAVLNDTRVEPGKLSLGETEGGPVTGTLTIRNKGPVGVGYAMSHQAALASGPNTFGVSLFDAPSTVSFSANPVSVPAGGSATVDVTVTPHPDLFDRSVFGGYLILVPDDGGLDVRVPYAGFKGDYQSIPSLVPTTFEFPWLARQVGMDFVNQPGGATYTLQSADVPIIILHLDHPVSLLRFEVFDAVTGVPWHRVLNDRDWPRNIQPANFFAFGWDGFTTHGQQVVEVPNGRYVMKVSVRRALGDENDPAHWESWTSPVITLARPDLLVESFWVSQNSVQAGDQVTLSAAVENSGANPASGVVVEFFDSEASLGSSTLDLAAGETRVVETAWRVGESSQHRMKVKVSPLEVESSYANNEAGLDVRLGEAIVGVGGPGTRVLSLAPARPNPFNGKVAFRFTLPGPGPATVEIFDLAGRRLKSWRWGTLEAGEHALDWDGRTEQGQQAPAGTLLLRLNAMGRTLTQKAVRLP